MKNDKAPKYKCGEIYYIDIPETGGSVQHGYRPCLIVSNNVSNWYSPVVNVIPVTTRRKESPVHVRLENFSDYGLTKPSTLLVEQMMPVPVDSIGRYVGEIRDAETLLKIAEAMGVQFPMLDALIKVKDKKPVLVS